METNADRTADWAAALIAAAAAPGLEAALASAWDLLLPETGAAAAAVARCPPLRLLSTWRCQPAAVERRLARLPLAPGAVPAARPPRDASPAGAALEIVRLDAGHEPGTFLLLFLPADAPPDARLTGVDGVAALARLLVERDRHAEAARRAAEVRDHFLVAVHHELRTPATALTFEAGLLQSGRLGELAPKLRASLARVETNVAELIRVVQRVLDLAQLDTAAPAARDDLVDPREAIVALARQVEPEAQRKGVGLSLFFPRVLPVIQTDGDRFRRVLVYLLGNAVKYSATGQVQLRVQRATIRGGDGARHPLLAVRVVDAGQGIPAADLDRVFEPFAQVEEGARTDSGTRGLGLGLSLARKLARSLGGEVTVDSEPGKGTTATFLLPYQPEP